MAIKLFFLDMEGTIFSQLPTTSGSANGSLWHKIAAELGEEGLAQDEAMYQKWERGEYRSYLDWCAETAAMYQTRGLTRAQFHSLITAVPYNEGAKDLLAELHRRNIVTAIISGGFMAQAGRAQQDLRIRHAFASLKLFWNAQGHVDHWNVLPANEEGKVDFVELLRREYGFSKEECAFVGDGKNDVHIAEHVGLSFAYNAHPALQQAATHQIKHLTDILGYL